MTEPGDPALPPRVRASPALSAVPPYPFAELEEGAARRRRAGREVLNFGIGDPDLPPPTWLVESAQHALADPFGQGYSTSRGEEALREAIARWMLVRFGVRVDPQSEVVVLVGSKEGLVGLPRALLGPGEGVGVPDPGYPVYTAATVLAGGRAVRLPLDRESGYLPNWDAFPHGPRLVYLNYPNNPTGRTVDVPALREAVDRARDQRFLLAYDNAYSEMAYGGSPAPSVLEVPDASHVAVEFHSFSKTFGVAGWRLGFAVGNAEAIRLLTRLKSQGDSGAATPLQRAAAEALGRYQGREPPVEVRSSIEEYRRRLERLSAGLTGLGFSAPMPEGGLYLWQEVERGEGARFARQLLEETGIAVTPGAAFGSSGAGNVRWAATRPGAEIDRALTLLRSRPPV